MKSAKAALVMVFSRPRYWIITLGVAALFILVVGGIVYFSALSFIVKYSGFGAWPRGFIQILWLNNTAWSLAILFSTAILAGINVALMIFQLSQRVAATTSGFTGGAGAVLGLIGVGCASCGSVVLSSVLGVGAATSFLALFPWQGKEFGILAIVISGIGVYITCRKIMNPSVCAIQGKYT